MNQKDFVNQKIKSTLKIKKLEIFESKSAVNIQICWEIKLASVTFILCSPVGIIAQDDLKIDKDMDSIFMPMINQNFVLTLIILNGEFTDLSLLIIIW
ncbi:transmembrane protein, putative (macronuclear) [Tetrahymena thermophila SB210]|uniref:Transmembrane protein, putative n=1 Tax=Tetrahymena thermophila (strain SB210) TaxID=312017 RepID=Q23R63_TETTS|nr:transmembrane protein, putative [Tetrahymena thermophila SB210]EAR98978.1 transmembrane protein, putative [Tetrahymena thermophila SB210]|eukprot:XP_001019223.1 transmembrane protein, putative [Tetrahymena thermophila SB210]